LKLASGTRFGDACSARVAAELAWWAALTPFQRGGNCLICKSGLHVWSDHKLDRVVALMSRMTTARVGVSAAFKDLRETPRALHVARVMLRGPTNPDPQSLCSTAPSWPPLP